MSEVKVLQIPPGSLIVLQGVSFYEDDMMADLISALWEKCGHNDFVILNVPDGGVAEVFGSVEEAVERVRQALDDAGLTNG